jgi:hypothetical protein
MTAETQMRPIEQSIAIFVVTLSATGVASQAFTQSHASEQAVQSVVRDARDRLQRDTAVEREHRRQKELRPAAPESR